jgi:hypothetical protein
MPDSYVSSVTQRFFSIASMLSGVKRVFPLTTTEIHGSCLELPSSAPFGLLLAGQIGLGGQRQLSRASNCSSPLTLMQPPNGKKVLPFT